jgi:hypothetical protein
MMTFLGQFVRDLRYACRTIVRAPVLSAVVIFSLGVGIGVNTAVFSWIQFVIFQPLPGVRDSGSLLLVEPRAETGSYPGVSWLEYRDLRERLRALPDLLAFRFAPLNVGDPGRTERTYTLLVSDNYFASLGLRPAAGRFLRGEDVAHPGGEPVAVVSHDYWQTRLGGDPNVIGRTLRVDDRVLTIVGVTPPGFQGTSLGLTFDVWVPATLAPALFPGSQELDSRDVRGYLVMGRLAQGATRAQAQVELETAMRGATLPEEQRAYVRRAAAVLAAAPRAANHAGACTDRAAGCDAAPAVDRVRQHGEPDAGSREHAAA